MENAENIQTTQVAPVPAKPEADTAPETKVIPVEVKPADQAVDVNKKQADAFIKMRQESRELKRKLAEAQANAAPPKVETPPAPNANIVPTVPAQKAVRDIEAESAKAIEQLYGDADVNKVAGGLLDIISLVDSDPRLLSLHDIDPIIAFREAKEIWKSKLGIAPAPIVANSAPTSGGIGTGQVDLQVLVDECNKYKPGTKEFAIAADKVKAEMNKLHKM